jgi:hydrogenase/urease accessory protein HupE
MKNLLALAALLPSTAFAHEDHGSHLFEGLMHVLSSPEHVWPLTIGIGVVAYIIIKRRS